MPGLAALQALRPAELGELLRRGGYTLGAELPGDGAPRRFAAEPGAHAEAGALLVEVHGAAPPFSLRRHVSLRHRNLLRLHQVSELRGLAVLVCEAPSGLPLSELRAGGALPFELALEVLRQVAAGLAAVHQAGLCHGRVLLGNVFDRADGGEDGQVALGPPRASGGEGEAEIAADLRQLAALFAGLLFEGPLAREGGELAEALRRIEVGQGPAPRGTFELYALIEAAAARDGRMAAPEDSSAIRLPGGAPEPAAPRAQALGSMGGGGAFAFQDSGDGDDTTLEMERIDAADLPAFALDRSLSDLVGPLEQRLGAAPGPEGSDDDDDSDQLPRQAPRTAASRSPPGSKLRRRAEEGTPPSSPAEARTGPSRAPLLLGPARWLVPLGVATLLVLLLAAWVLLRGP